MKPMDELSEKTGTAPRLYERAQILLAERILEGTLPPGSRLNESMVARQFGISRAPARRALEELQRAGLVAKAAGRGYTVRAHSGGAQSAPSVRLPAEGQVRLSSLSSWEPIYGEVENEIVARISFASWRVNEAELARFYHVSRTVAREVVARLQQRGVVRKDERSRYLAPQLTPGHIGELYELRWILEPVALVKATASIPSGLLIRMRAHLEDAIQAGATVQGATLDRLEEEMHVELLGHCGAGTLMQAITLHQSLLIAHRFLYRWTPRLFEAEPFLPEHLDILERLERGRVAAAAEALENHLRVSRERAIARVEIVMHAFRPEELPYLTRIRTAL